METKLSQEDLTNAKVIAEVCSAFLDAISATGNAGVPSGYLYAQVCDIVPLHLYNELIGLLERGGFIENKGHLLKALVRRRES